MEPGKMFDADAYRAIVDKPVLKHEGIVYTGTPISFPRFVPYAEEFHALTGISLGQTTSEVDLRIEDFKAVTAFVAKVIKEMNFENVDGEAPLPLAIDEFLDSLPPGGVLAAFNHFFTQRRVDPSAVIVPISSTNGSGDDELSRPSPSEGRASSAETPTRSTTSPPA